MCVRGARSVHTPRCMRGCTFVCCRRHPAFACEARARLHDKGVGHVRVRGARACAWGKASVRTSACMCGCALACKCVRGRAWLGVGVRSPRAITRPSLTRAWAMSACVRAVRVCLCAAGVHVCGRMCVVRFVCVCVLRCSWGTGRCCQDRPGKPGRETGENALI